MKRFQRVIEILDTSVGGPDSALGGHGPFWRGLSRDDFVAHKVFGLNLIEVGNGAHSNIVLALRGTVPFGADLGVSDAAFNRMPSGRTPVHAGDISFIEQWIDEGCPDDEISPNGGAHAGETAGPVPEHCRWRPKLETVAEVMAEGERDVAWIRDALSIAIRLELSTLPPYLLALWSIEDEGHPVAKSIHEIIREEMLHFGLACNMLVAVGGTPRVANAGFVPKYPDRLPGGVRPNVLVSLRKLTKAQARVFMEIERPYRPVTPDEGEPDETIGQFYDDLLDAFRALSDSVKLDTARQLDYGSLRLFKIDSLDSVERAISIINAQGEGSASSPEEGPEDLAHYYRFGEIHHERRIIRKSAGDWAFEGETLELPKVYNVAEIPGGGYKPEDATPEAWELITRFDAAYSDMLRSLESAWMHGNASALGQAVGHMFSMRAAGRALVKLGLNDVENYGPCFRYVD